MTDLALDGALPVGHRRAAPAWIVSPGFDFFLLIAAPLVTLPILAAIYFQLPTLAIMSGVMLAFAHYSSSLAFYFWEENRDYHRRRWLAFAGGPLILAAVYLILIQYRIPYIVQFILFFWNTFHVARQNSGILSIYRHGSGVADVNQRNAANRAILAVSTFLALWNIDTHKEVAALFGLVSSDFSLLVRGVSGLVAVVALVQLGLALWKRPSGAFALPEKLFLLASLAFFYPYIVITDSEFATFAMLLPHYVQYMALVWLLHRRKFGDTNAGGVPPLLKLMSRRLEVLVPVLAGAGLTFYFFHEISLKNGVLDVFEVIYLLIALEHFYMDGLIWSFKQPHVRQTIGRFLQARPVNA